VNIARTYDTVRYLRPVQIANRLQRRLSALRAIPVLSEDLRLTCRRPVRPVSEQPSGFDGKGFRFLNVRYSCSGDRRWTPEGAPRLWTYNLHYFEYLWGLAPVDALRLLDDWVASNTDVRSPGWEPYPLSLRIREWLEWLHANPHLPPDQQQRLVRSVASQAEALSRQVELHLLGNHIAENAITLCWAGLSFAGAQPDAWLRRGLRLMQREVTAQVLDDGVHDERSPMYQALLAQALLRLAEVGDQVAGPRAAEITGLSRSAGGRLLRGLGHLVHPDGDYALVNDCALGVAPTLAQLQARFPATDGGQTELGQNGGSGYCSWRQGTSYLLFDAGPLGPDYQPGHGHADNLSFELSVAGGRLITDTGVFSYAEGREREIDRSTAAHNTVEVDGQNQADVWAAFRCGRRPIVRQPHVETSQGNGLEVRGAYRVVRARRGTVEHERSIRVSPASLHVVDGLQARGEHTARVRLHFAPGIDLEGGGREWRALDSGRLIARVRSDVLNWSRSGSPYHPEFGLELERQCLTATVCFRDSIRTDFSMSFT